MAENLLQIKNLSVKANSGQSLVLKNISFDIPEGIITGIAGESGSGKSMTALSIMGLLPKNLNFTGGEIIFKDKEQFIDLCSLNEKTLNEFRGKKSP